MGQYSYLPLLACEQKPTITLIHIHAATNGPVKCSLVHVVLEGGTLCEKEMEAALQKNTFALIHRNDQVMLEEQLEENRRELVFRTIPSSRMNVTIEPPGNTIYSSDGIQDVIFHRVSRY